MRTENHMNSTCVCNFNTKKCVPTRRIKIWSTKKPTLCFKSFIFLKVNPYWGKTYEVPPYKLYTQSNTLFTCKALLHPTFHVMPLVFIMGVMGFPSLLHAESIEPQAGQNYL